MYYIYEDDKLSKIKKIFNIVKLVDNKIIVPINEEITERKKLEKIALKTKKILLKNNCNKVIVSKKIKQEEQYINYLNSYNINIIDGLWLFEILSYDVLEYIIKKNNMKKEETSVSIAINEVTDIILPNIIKIAKDYKRINIITNHISKFKNIEKQILENEGVMITVADNKKKSMSKSRIILNVDFPSELINKYNINENAIIVNLKGNVKIKSKRFKGININDYEITYSNKELYFEDYSILEKYYKKDIYEALIYKRQPFENVVRKLKKDNVKIDKLVGCNSIY